MESSVFAYVRCCIWSLGTIGLDEHSDSSCSQHFWGEFLGSVDKPKLLLLVLYPVYLLLMFSILCIERQTELIFLFSSHLDTDSL